MLTQNIFVDVSFKFILIYSYLRVRSSSSASNSDSTVKIYGNQNRLLDSTWCTDSALQTIGAASNHAANDFHNHLVKSSKTSRLKDTS